MKVILYCCCCFLQQTFKQLEVIWKVVLSEISKLNDLGKWEQWKSSVELDSFLQEEDGFHCFCCSNPVIYRMMDHFMNEIIDGILQFCNFFHLPKMIVIYLDLFKHETANECRKTFKQSYGDKKEWV